MPWAVHSFTIATRQSMPSSGLHVVDSIPGVRDSNITTMSTIGTPLNDSALLSSSSTYSANLV